jgi:hypothetical protein
MLTQPPVKPKLPIEIVEGQSALRRKEIENKKLRDQLKLIACLREKIQELLSLTQNQEKEIYEQKQKMSQMTIVIHRAKLGNIHCADNCKRQKICMIILNPD